MLAMLAWTLVVIVSLVWNWRMAEKQAMDLPVAAASVHLQTILASSHGVIWFLGLTGIGLMTLTLRKSVRRLRQLDQERMRADQRYRLLFEQARDGIVIVDPQTRRFIEYNTVAHQQLGYSREEFAAMGIADIEVIETPEDTAQRIESIRMRGWDDFETVQRHKDGSFRDVQVIVQMLTLDHRLVMYCSFRDITERKAAERALHLYANIFRHSGEGIVITDSDNRIIQVNPAFTRFTGYTLEDIRGENPRILSAGRTARETYQKMWADLLGESGFWQGELWDRRKTGSIYPKWAAISSIRDKDGEISNYIASFTDISERKAAEERIDYLAHFDVLTGLPNRYSLESRLGQVLLTARREKVPVAVMFIDLDRFKVINDSLGHHIGDLLLAAVADRLQTSVRESDIVSRLGGDEFVVVLTGIAAAVDAAPISEKILRGIGEPYLIEGYSLHTSPSIGISIFPDDGTDSEALMKAADTAMYHAKEQGRNNSQFFTAGMNAAAGERLELERELRTALREGQLELHYQPQIRTRDDRICAVEALLRWRHPVRGLVPPLKFIPIAEESGQIETLGLWVLDEACGQLAAWRAEGIAGLRMAVNLSAHQLRSPDLVEAVRNALDRHGLRQGDLELEVTESAAMADPEGAIDQLYALQTLGIHLAIDDFGTGYSSLAYLKLLPIQTLKLDRAFVRDIESDENDAAISAATLALAHGLGLKVVAEGVETEGQSRFLRQHGCDFLQGYLYGRPEPAAVATELLREVLGGQVLKYQLS